MELPMLRLSVARLPFQAITHQYTPLNNTIIYNGLAGTIGRYEL